MEVKDINFLEVLERITDAFFALDKDFRVIYINNKGAEILNLSQTELIGQCLWDIFPNVINSDLYQNYHQALQAQEMVEFEYFYKRINQWLLIRAYPSQSGLTIFFEDITEKYISQTIHDEYYKSLFDQNPNGIYSLDLAGNITSVNKGIEKITGYPLNYFSNKKYTNMNFVIKEDAPKLENSVIQAKSGVVQSIEFRISDNDGSIIYCKSTHFPIKVGSEIVGVYGIVEDITELKELSYNLMQSEKKYRSLKLHNPDGICSYDLNGRLIGSNPALEKITGYSFEELNEMKLADIASNDDYHLIISKLQEIQASKESIEISEVKITNKRGHDIFVKITIIPIVIEEELEGYYFIVKDVTATRKTEELLIQS